MYIFLSSVYLSGFCHLNIGIHIHFSMNTEILQIRFGDQLADCVRHPADSKLEA